MGDKNRGYKIGLLFGVLSLLCGIFVYAFPDSMTSALEYLTHGKFEYAPQPFNPVRLVIGAVVWAIIGFGSGVLYEKISDYFDKK